MPDVNNETILCLCYVLKTTAVPRPPRLMPVTRDDALHIADHRQPAVVGLMRWPPMMSHEAQCDSAISAANCLGAACRLQGHGARE